MRFLSDILAKAGLIVDGAVVFNSTANGQTPASNDDSTKLATTAWVRSFTQPYTLPIASATILGGVKVGTGLAIDPVSGVLSLSGGGVSIKSTETFTATQGQSIFTITNGYTVGLIDVFLNGVYLSPGQITATNGITITLNDPAIVGDIIDVIVTSPLSEGSLATTDQLPEGTTNLYYTDSRARAAISLTTTGVSGAATYNILTGQLNIPNYQGLVPAGGIAGQILAKNSATSYDTTWIDNYTSQVQHIVKAGVAVTKGQAVYVSSADGTNMIVSKASNASEGTSSKTLGLIAQDLALNGQGFVVTEGLLTGLDTTGANAAGDPVWLGTDGNLIYGLVNKPVAPAHLVFIGVVTRRNANNGEIFVKVQNGFELDELHNLSVKNASDGDMIKYVASTGLWTKIAATTTNISEGTNLYYTDVRVGSYLTANSYATQSYVATQIANLVASAPATLDTLNELATALGNDPNFATTVTTSIGTKVPQARTITINGTAYDLSADRTWSIAAGVTSFNTRTGAITLTSADVTGALGYTPYNATNPSGYITGITSGMVTTALGFTPYNSTNPSGYITSSALSAYLPLTGGTMTGDITINGQRIKELSSTNKGIYLGNWFGAGYWGLGSTATAHELKLDQVNTTTGAWENATDVNLYLGNNRLVLHSDNIGSQSVAQANQLFLRTANGTPYSANTADLGIFSNYYGGGQITNVPDSSYGSLYTFGGYNNISLSLQLYSTVNHNTTSPTRSLYFRMGNNLGFGNDWHNLLDASNHPYAASMNQHVRQGDDVTHAIVRASNYMVSAIIYSGGGNITLGNNVYFPAVDRGLEANTSGGVSFYSNEINAGSQGGTGDLYLAWRRTNSVNVGARLNMGTVAGIQQYIRMGVFSNSQGNNGEAWIGRASDRNAGTMTVQLGGGSASSRSFEVVDYAWSVVLFSVGSNGNATASGDITAYSDLRIKTNIETISNALDKVTSLRGVTYNRIDTADKSKKMGVIAQETQNVIPEVVQEQENGMLSVAYGNMSGLFIEAIKEQQTQIETQQSEIAELKDLVKQLLAK